jgi:hypothetical protein
MNKEPILTGLFPKEDVLPDNYPVHYDYIYIVDGKIIRSDLGETDFGNSTVKDLKRLLNVKEIRKCDLAARNLL